MAKRGNGAGDPPDDDAATRRVDPAAVEAALAKVREANGAAAEPEEEEEDEEEGEGGEPRADEAGMVQRFPALRRLEAFYRGRRIPEIQQMTVADCGAACLAMVLGYHGKSVRLDEVRETTGVGRDGVDALTLLKAGRYYGLRGRGVKLEDVDHDLDYLEPATILHWEFNHFVVFDRQRRNGVEIVDPAFGRRFVPMEQFRRSFTGIAVLFEPTDAFVPSVKGQKRIWRYVRQLVAHSGLLSRVIVTSLMLQLFALALPLLTGALVDRVVPRSDYHLLTVLTVGLAAIVLFQALATLIRSHLLLELRTLLDTRMTLGFLEHLVALPFSYFQQRSTGDLMMRLNSNATIRETLTSTAVSAVIDGLLVVIYLVMLLLVSPTMGLLVLGLGMAQCALFFFSRRRQHELMQQSIQAQVKSQNYLVQVLHGIETLKMAGAELRSTDFWSNLYVDELNVALRRGRLGALVDALGGALRLGAPLAILGFGGLKVLHGELQLGEMLALNALGASFLGPLATLISTALQLQLLGTYIERIDDVLDTVPEQPDQKPSASKLRGRIVLDQVSFRHGPLAPLVVKEVSIEVKPGQVVAIVGRSGSGKSTLARLLAGLYRPTTGRVLYDDQDLAELDLRWVRAQLGVVTQDPYLFGTSIRDNIALADPSLPLERVVKAAKAACIHDDIVAMPMGYETPIVEGGASLSGGQRQRLALARALVHHPAILLLDEATSALDTVTETDVQRNLIQLRCTRIVIAHRLSTVADADLILVMDEGRLVESGTHGDLLRRHGEYAKLIEAQL